MSEPCLFCQFYQDKRGIIFENDHFYARFDEFPVSPGHAEVMPKRHVESLLDVSQTEWEALLSALQSTVKIIETTDFIELYTSLLTTAPNEKAKEFCRQALESPFIIKKPDGYNFGNNDGEAAGRTIHHLHIHIIPRYTGDVGDAKGGIRTVIPNKGNYHAKS